MEWGVGGTPKLWNAEWCRDLYLSERDRLFHEVGVLVGCLCQAGETWVAGRAQRYCADGSHRWLTPLSKELMVPTGIR